MRLINVKDLTFKEVYSPRDCKYATISHRWGDEEVSYQDFLRDRSGPKRGYGWTKILQGCRIAGQAGLEWIWVDTCCINKDSSAELTEAINSMYRWYWEAQVCYMFLNDVHSLGNGRKARLDQCEEVLVAFSQDEFKRSPGSLVAGHCKNC